MAEEELLGRVNCMIKLSYEKIRLILSDENIPSEAIGYIINSINARVSLINEK